MFESLLFRLPTLRVATVNFAEANKLGEGGFGAVYKVHPHHVLLLFPIQYPLVSILPLDHELLCRDYCRTDE